MPSRRDVFLNGKIYHVFDKTIDHRNIFADPKLGRLFLDLFRYYRSNKAIVRYSHFLRMPGDLHREVEKQIKIRKYFKIEILNYNLMPNHFHLVLKQMREKGIVRFVSDCLNSLTRFYNILNERKGPIFLPQFRSRQIITEEQFKHLMRYVDLNPYSSQIIKNLANLEKNEFSSFKEYLHPSKNDLCDTSEFLKLFNLRNNKINYIFGCIGLSNF